MRFIPFLLIKDPECHLLVTWQHKLLTSSKRALFADEIAYFPKDKMGIFHCLKTGEKKATAPRIIIEMQTTTIYADSWEDYQRRE